GCDAKRVKAGAENSAPLARDVVDVAEREGERRKRDAPLWAEGCDGAAVARVELRLRGEQFAVRAVERPTGESVNGRRVVQGGGVGDAPDLRHLVHLLRHVWQVLAHGDAWCSGR